MSVAKKRKLEDDSVVEHLKKGEIDVSLGREQCGSILSRLYENLDRDGDLLVMVPKADEECTEGSEEQLFQTFKCMTGILVEASPVINQMIFGKLSHVDNVYFDETMRIRVLKLDYVSSACFDMMLKFVHGLSIKLNIDTAAELYACSDYYEIMPLCNACEQFLEDSINAYTFSTILSRATASHCRSLEDRCVHMLTLEFSSIAMADATFWTIEAEVLEKAIQSNDLTCITEGRLVHALLRWYTGPEGDVKLIGDEKRRRSFMDMLYHVRWKFVDETILEEILSDPRLLVVPEAKELVSNLAGGCHEHTRARNQWGALIAHDHPDATVQYYGGQCKQYILATDRETRVGRSRKSDIRVGHLNPMPYVSALHFVIKFNVDYSCLREGGLPVRTAILRDKAQNGVFVNGERIDRDVDHVLQDGDRIDTVFSSGEAPGGEDRLPHFIYSDLFVADARVRVCVR